MIERSIGFGPGRGLIGTLCLPEAPVAARARVGQILFNAGVVHRVGPHRINVRLARSLARRGIPSLRFDLAGQGDSARADGRLPYEVQAIADLRCAIDLLGSESGVDRFALLGFCSGGFHSYGAALADERIAGLLFFDAFQYPTFKTRYYSYVARLRRRGLASAVTWASRQMRRLPQTIGSAIRARGSSAVEDPFTPPKLEFAERLRKLHARGVKLAFIYSSGFDQYSYAGQFADSFRGLGVQEIAQCDYLPGMDHTATVIAMQANFLRRIEAFVAGLDGELRAPDSR